MWTEPLLVLLLQTVLAGAAALLAPRAKPLALVLGGAVFLGVPWLAGSIALLRALSALFGWILLFRIVDLVRSREPWSASRRVLHVLSVVDSRTLRRGPRHIDFPAFGHALLWAALAAVGFYVAHSPRQLVRWGGGLVLAYALLESGWAFIGAAYRAIGFVTPPLHVHPIASLSIGELWGVRWARPVSAWLRDTCFRPLARRRHPTLGLLFGFVVSAIGHAYPLLVATDLRMAAMMFAFFSAQGMFVLVEARLGVSRWSRAARRAWTVTIMVASSPLFLEPALRLLGVRP